MKINFFPIIEKFNQLEIRLRYAAFAGVLLVIFALDLFTVLRFQWVSLQRIGHDNQALHEGIDHLKEELQKIDQMKSGLQHSRSQMEAMDIKIRSVGGVSSIQENMSRIAIGSGIKIEQLTPQSDAEEVLITSGAVKYYARPIELQASAGFHMFGRFMNQLESERFLFTLSHLTIEDQGDGIDHHHINAVFKVVLSDKNVEQDKAASPTYADDLKAPVYNDHGKMDPFAPLVSPGGDLISYDSLIAAPVINLEGLVIYAKGDNLAVINEKIYQVNDRIGNYRIDVITNDHVDLVKGHELLAVKLKNGVL